MAFLKANTDDNPQKFERFWVIEQDKAFIKLVQDESLSRERTQTLIEHYLYSEQVLMRDRDT
jgi:type I restriction enzyme R subunit